MSLALGNDGVVYLATRSDVCVNSATRKAPAVADERKVIVRLDTRGRLSAQRPVRLRLRRPGRISISAMGENLGEPYKPHRLRRTTLSGGGEGGSIFRCRPDGTELERLATGFWNPFHMTFDAFGRLFAVDNDPDARGPCRLLHIVPGGDYGYRFRYGRKGPHPFIAWNGELPGTLPMAAGTGEAPSGILAYEVDGFPKEYRGQLLVTSWGDHVVERFTRSHTARRSRPMDTSWCAAATTSGRWASPRRPTATCTSATGWTSSYQVHGKGRIWRIRPKERTQTDPRRPFRKGTKSAPPPRLVGRLAGSTVTRPQGCGPRSAG